ncbi:MAG: hypothetical protein RLY30_1986 [Pseudomonadota bacterium]
MSRKESVALGLGALMALTSANAESRFFDNDDGTLTDRAAQITWMRCSLGQHWDKASSACQGKAVALSLDQAREAVQYENRKKGFYQDWRLPSLTELARIANGKADLNGARISEESFPGTPAAFFWTSSAKASSGYEPLWFALSFGSEGLTAVSADNKFYVRLVRTGN